VIPETGISRARCHSSLIAHPVAEDHDARTLAPHGPASEKPLCTTR
jgi:hypothetical protein